MFERVKVIIYSKPDCHLCDEAKKTIGEAGCNDLFSLEEINIESDVELLARHRDDIPVIVVDGAVAFKHRLTAEEFRRRLAVNVR